MRSLKCAINTFGGVSGVMLHDGLALADGGAMAVCVWFKIMIIVHFARNANAAHNTFFLFSVCVKDQMSQAKKENASVQLPEV